MKILKIVLIITGTFLIISLLGYILKPNENTITDKVVFETFDEIYRGYKMQILKEEEEIKNEKMFLSLEEDMEMIDRRWEAEQKATKEIAEKFGISEDEVFKKCFDYTSSTKEIE
jgi:hypothetical protein